MSTLRSGLCRPGIILYLALVLLAARSTHSAPMYETDSTQVAEYDGSTSGCYYNFQRYQEGARIITNEPCLNCTCHNRMLMCYLRVCPFTKAIGQDCTVEKRPDQCCPVITCPEVPVQLLTSTTSSPSKSSSSSSILPAGSSSTELGFPDTYGCNVNDRFFADGAQLPVDSNNPCELCYCIRNKTTCLMQQCTLSVAGCRPVYQPGICCPVKYNCEYDEDTTAGTTPGLIMTTTLAPHSPPLQCHHDGKMYEDGELIYTIQPCQHCYCFHGDIVCAVQNCGDPMKPHSKNCTALPPLEGECCPTTYQCEDDFGNISTEIPQNEDKNVPQQSIEPGKDQQESFPGADNAIPEEIITDSTLTTEQPQTISPFGNEVSELEPTASTITEDIAKENKFTTLKPESEEVTESAERQHLTISPSENKLPVTESTLSSATEAETKEEAHSTLNPEKDESSELSESQQPEGKMPEPASVEAASEVTSTNKISDETEPSSNISEQPSTTLSLTIEEEITPEVSKEESPITESNILEEASTESKSQIDIEFTTLAAEEKATEKSNDEESISAIATEKEAEESDKHSTPSTESNDELEHNKPTVIVTESQIAEESTTVASEEKEKSSEPSSPISTITTTEQNIRIDVTESEFSTASIESEQRFDTSQDENIKHDQMTTVKPSTEEHAVEQTDESIALTTGIPQEVDAPTSPESFMVTSSDGINKSISTIPEIRYDNSITESPIESKSSEEAKEPSSSESSTEDVISDDAKPKEVDTIVPERSTSSNEVKESEEPGVTDISEISTNIEEGKQTEKSEEPVNLETSTTAEVSDKSIISEEVDTVAPAGSTASSSEDKEIEESITLASPKISTAESVAEEKQPAESEEPVNTETSTANISAENAKSEEAGTIKSESSAATTSSEDVISEESVTVSIPESSVTTVSDEQKQPETDLSIPKETSTLVSADEDENKITKQPVQSDTTEELISATSASVTIDTEKLNSNEVLSQSTTEIQTPSQSASEENTEEPVIPEQGPAGIPMPSRVPEYKAEDKDAVTDVGITEVYFSTGNGILHNVDNLITEYPEYGSTTYLPPLGSSTETDRQPSTPLYEDLPKEDTIGDTTEVSITPKISSEQTTTHIDETSDHEDHEIQTETPESSSDMLEEKEPVEEGMIITKAPIEEIKAETSSTDVPAEEHTLKEMPTTVESKISEPEITQTSTDKPLSEEMTTQLPILIDQTTEEEEEELKDKSEVLAELTTISAEEHTKSSEIDVEKISEETSDEEKVMTESPKQTEESTQVSEIELSTKQILKDTTVSESTEKAIDDQQPTKESETTTSSETISEESTELGTANEDHVIDSSEQSSSTESEEESVGDVVLPTESHIISEPEVNKPDISEETSEKSMEIPELSITTTSSLTDKVTEFVEKVETIPDEIINEEKENLPTKEPEDSRDKESPIVPTSIDLSTEIPAKETKLSDEQTTKGTLLTESEISSQSTLNNKFESDKPQYHDIISSTSSMIESVTDSSDSEFTSTLGSSEPLEEDKPSEISSETEKELTHSTQSTLTISSQTPEIEITSSAEPDVWPIAGIPGEGNCLVDGQSYTNNSAIPPANSCQLSCRCVSSIVQCELVQCSPPPSNLLNCTPIFSEADSCCPMYTCDSTPSVKLEAGNQMSDHHTPTYEDESQPQTSHPSIVDATSELTTFTEKVKSNEETTESLNKSQLEIAESTSIAPEAEKESVPPASPVEGETMSPSTSTESTSATPAESGVSVQMNIEESSPSHTPIETTNIQKESASETTESIQVTSIKSIEVDKTEATDKEVTISSQKPEIESVSEKEMNEPEQTTESTEEISKPSLEEEMPAVPIETSSSTQNVPDEETNEVSTQSTKLTTDEIEKTDTDMSIQGEEHTEKTQENVTPESAFQTTYSSAEPTKAETQKETSESTEIPTSSEETKLTSEDSQESVTPMTEDKIVEEETQEPKDVDLEHSSLPTEISSLGSDETSQKMNTEPSEVLVEETTSTSILSEVDTSKPTKSESESLTTVLPEKQSTLTSITTETEDKTTESTGTEKIFEISDSTVSSEPSSSTEENLTVAVMVNQPEESHSPVFTITETPEETTVVEKSQEEPEQSTTLSPTESHPTESSELVELPQSTSEIELTSSTSPSTMSSSDENVPDQTITNAPDQNKTYPEVDQTESEDTATASSTEKLDKKPQEVTTESFEETSKETVTTTAGETEKLRPTESLLEVEKETSEPFAKTTESAIEIKVPINTELPQVSEDKEEDVQTITTEISKLHESSPSTAEEPSSTIRESEHPFESSTESHVEKAEAASTHTTNEPEITTLAKVDEETSSKEPLSTPELTKIEIPSEEHNQQTPTESSNAELMPTTGEESSDETSTEHDKKSHSTEATISEVSSGDLTPTENESEKEHSIESNISEEPTFEVSAGEIQTTTAHEKHEQSTKAAVPQDESTSSKPSEVTSSEDNQYQIDSQQTEEPVIPGLHNNEEERPIESTPYSEISKPHTRPEYPDEQKPETDDENIFPPEEADIKSPLHPDEPETDDYDDQAVYGPGTCRYGGKIYMSAQQIPRDDPCDFCFCFRSDIICLQQSCPPPIPGCHEEPIGGFCCPRYECPVSMATSVNITTTTTTTTTTLPPHFLSHAYKGSAFRGGCQIGNKSYRVGEDIKSKSGPCMGCTCGGDGKMKCEPKACSASPMLKEMIAHAAARKRRR